MQAKDKHGSDRCYDLDGSDSQAEKQDALTLKVAGKYLNDLRKAAALHIDSETAEVEWTYAQTLDPYGDDLNLPEEYQQVGRAYFARTPGSDVWVWFGDLPDAARDALWKKHASQLAFPAGLDSPAESDFTRFAMDYMERNFGPISSLPADKLAQAIKAAHKAYLAAKNEACQRGDASRDREDGTKS